MSIEVRTTTLWAELATWSPTALESILRPEHWAIHGATRMGKALTAEDRVDPAALGGASLAAGVEAAAACMALLKRADAASSPWTEPAPPAVASAEEAARAIASSGVDIASVAIEGIELITAVAHALQAGATIAPRVSEAELRAFVATPPRVAPRSSGPFSALLVVSVDTTWVPTTLKHTWDAPACVIASSDRLASDLAALPDLFRAGLLRGDDTTWPDLRAACVVVRALDAALAAAGRTHCVRMKA